MRYQKILALIVVFIGLTVLVRNFLVSNDVNRYVSLGTNIRAWADNSNLSEDLRQDALKASAKDSAKFIYILRETRRDLLLAQIFSASAVLYGVPMYFGAKAPDKKKENKPHMATPRNPSDQF